METRLLCEPQMLMIVRSGVLERGAKCFSLLYLFPCQLTRLTAKDMDASTLTRHTSNSFSNTLIGIKMGFHRLIVTLHCQGEQHKAAVTEAVVESGIE